MPKDKYTPPPSQYQGTELLRDPSIPAERMRAFDLPSRVGNMLFYPDGRVRPFPCTTLEPAA